jgi:hypothetical protein
MAENAREQMGRLRLMAVGDEKWDLSDNDCAAVQYALDRIATLETELARLKAEIPAKQRKAFTEGALRGLDLDSPFGPSEKWVRIQAATRYPDAEGENDA